MSHRTLYQALALISVIAGVLGAQGTKVKARHETQSQLRAEAKISEADARKVALAEVPNGKLQSSELEREGGRLIYSFDIKVTGKSGIEEVHVDALDGKVIAHEHETPKDEKKEAKAEKKEAKADRKDAKAEAAKKKP